MRIKNVSNVRVYVAGHIIPPNAVSDVDPDEFRKWLAMGSGNREIAGARLVYEPDKPVVHDTPVVEVVSPLEPSESASTETEAEDLENEAPADKSEPE